MSSRMLLLETIMICVAIKPWSRYSQRCWVWPFCRSRGQSCPGIPVWWREAGDTRHLVLPAERRWSLGCALKHKHIGAKGWALNHRHTWVCTETKIYRGMDCNTNTLSVHWNINRHMCTFRHEEWTKTQSRQTYFKFSINEIMKPQWKVLHKLFSRKDEIIDN